LQPVREALPYSYQSWIVVYILQDCTGKINIFSPSLTIILSAAERACSVSRSGCAARAHPLARQTPQDTPAHAPHDSAGVTGSAAPEVRRTKKDEAEASSFLVQELSSN